MRSLVSNRADRRLDSEFPFIHADDRQVRGVGHEVGLQDLIGDFTRSTSGDRDTRKRSQPAEAILAQQDGQLSGS